MILGFKEYWNKNKQIPTQFKEQIFVGLKIHSIREDKRNRWKAGVLIEMTYDDRTPDCEIFHNETCTGTQRFEIEEMVMYSSEHCFVTESEKLFKISVDGRPLLLSEMEELASNDGFVNIGDLLIWFGEKNFTGKIIHWTDFRY